MKHGICNSHGTIHLLIVFFDRPLNDMSLEGQYNEVCFMRDHIMRFAYISGLCSNNLSVLAFGLEAFEVSLETKCMCLHIVVRISALAQLYMNMCTQMLHTGQQK